ncbi:hypothetical protein SETIT_8G176600v2 [Setaria italica]|uniref:Uncharacterized protein n=1 Tax=Setaria italica TaxID=4555 RepID=A0A368S953_SETIT|nr:hypothetical protein SETIT_8G176600v2 [Setaria italica]
MQVWQAIASVLNLLNQPPSQDFSTTDFWLHMRSAVDALKKRGIDSAFMLISWSIWKERNSRVFSRSPAKLYGQLACEISEQALLWCGAGAK